MVLRQPPADHINIENVVVGFSVAAVGVGIAGEQCAVVQLDGVSEAAATQLTDGCLNVQHDPIVLEFELEPSFVSLPTTARTPNGGSCGPTVAQPCLVMGPDAIRYSITSKTYFLSPSSNFPPRDN